MSNVLYSTGLPFIVLGPRIQIEARLILGRERCPSGRGTHSQLQETPMRISRLAKPIALVLAVTLTFMNFPTSLLAQVSAADVINETQKTLGKASPVNLLLGGLVDRAVESGNSALQQRLDQLNGILQSAIFSLNQVLKENIQNLDSAARKQRVGAVRALGGLIDQVN